MDEKAGQLLPHIDYCICNHVISLASHIVDTVITWLVQRLRDTP